MPLNICIYRVTRLKSCDTDTYTDILLATIYGIIVDISDQPGLDKDVNYNKAC